MILKRSYIKVIPGPASSIPGQLNDCLIQIIELLKVKKISSSDILRMSIFIDCDGNSKYRKYKKQFIKILNDHFKSTVPPFSIICQKPEGENRLQIELALIEKKDDTVIIEKGCVDSIYYTLIRTENYIELHTGGITADDPGSDLKKQCINVFERICSVLNKEDLGLSDIVRQWNYVENILYTFKSESGVQQHYQMLNDIRGNYYSKADYINGYPSATGIGTSAGGITIELIAIKPLSGKVNVIPLSNPAQINAHEYSEKVLVGNSPEESLPKSAPMFERGKIIKYPDQITIYISGTAAIEGQDTIETMDFDIQTKKTLDNISKLISKRNINKYCAEEIGPEAMVQSRVYVKKNSLIPSVSDICSTRFSNNTTLYLVADICREDLVVEIEGIIEIPHS